MCKLKYISDLPFLSPPKFLLHMHGCVVGMGVSVWVGAACMSIATAPVSMGACTRYVSVLCVLCDGMYDLVTYVVSYV